MAGVVYRKKVGGRKVLHSQSHEIVQNVYQYIKGEAENGGLINLRNI